MAPKLVGNRGESGRVLQTDERIGDLERTKKRGGRNASRDWEREIASLETCGGDHEVMTLPECP